jgi:thiamine-monophosphate kinase
VITKIASYGKPGPAPRSEDEIVRLLRDRFGGRSASLKMGIGDDAAVFHPAGAREYWAFSTDMLLEDVDFRKEWSGPRELGHKALAVNLSDLAAMGVRPRFHTVSLGIPEGISRRWIKDFYQGMARLAERHHVILVGGDLSHSTHSIHISVAILGESSRRKVVYRSGGTPGDFLYVTGILGRSASGLSLLRRGVVEGDSLSEREALAWHRTPEPRCEVGSWLAAHGFARAMIDLSDGLSMDLKRLATESGAGAEVYSSALPVFEPSRAWGCDPLELGFYGGEDYELLFSVPPARASALESHYPRKYPRINRIGRFIPEPDVIAVVKQPGAPRRRLPDRGFDHFRIQGTGAKPRPGRNHARKPPASRKKTKGRSGSRSKAKQLSFNPRIE